jgi:protein-S-isoprenylcysteine O-methyltransferase Ste14
MTGFAFILIPVCEECQKAYRRNYRQAFWRPMGIVMSLVAVAGFCGGAVPALAGIDPKSFPILPILCSLGLALASLPIVWIALRRHALKAAPPAVQLRRYVRNRRVSFRFRRPDYAAEVISLLEGAARSTER